MEVNTLDVICPTAAAMRMSTLSDGLSTNQVHAGANGKYYWKCLRGHVWWAPVGRLVNVRQNQPSDRDWSTIGCLTSTQSRNQHTTPRG